MRPFVQDIIFNFCVSFGIVVGASTCAGVAAIVCNLPPLKTMLEVATSLKIWAVAMVLGGTFSSFEALEQGLFKGEFKSIVRQVIFIVAALMGANAGQGLVSLLRRCRGLWPD